MPISVVLPSILSTASDITSEKQNIHELSVYTNIMQITYQRAFAEIASLLEIINTFKSDKLQRAGSSDIMPTCTV